MDIVKQVIVVRKDLNMPSGKLAAQVAHASLGTLMQKMRGFNHDDLDVSGYPVKLFIDLIPGDAWAEWLNGSFRKIVVYVKSEEKLLKIYEQAKEAGLPTVLIKDSGFTVFNEPTYTCVGIGPDFSSNIDPITKSLRLLD